jgi:RNA polymerase sigma-70 factor (ECF subfamily)
LNNLANALRHYGHDFVPLDTTGPTPIDHAVNDEQLMHLPDALDQLTESQRDAIVLHHLQGLSLADTAQRLGKTQPSVAGLLHRGLKKLRQLLERKVD